MFKVDSNEERLVKYLLGQMPDDEIEALSEKAFADDALYDEVLAAERELIDLYVNNDLNERDRRAFEERFLSDRRKERVEFAIALKTVAENARAAESSRREPKRWSLANLSAFWTWRPGSIAIAGAAVIAVIAAIAVWRSVNSQPDVNEGIAALAKAYSDERPAEVRITGLGYAPFSNQRGGAPRVNREYRDLAATLLLKAATSRPSAETRQALGKFYLTQRDFDQAIQEFEEALKSKPESAQLHADLGAALLEKQRAVSSGNNLEDLGGALEHLNKALDLDKSLAEALFNRALCYESLMLPEPAKRDWKSYLEIDRGSGWANEARSHLNNILEREKVSTGRVTGEDPSAAFLAAFQQGNVNAAWEALQKHQTSAGNQVVDRLLDRVIQSPHEQRSSAVAALSFAGNIAEQKSGDKLIGDLARFYGGSGKGAAPELGRARALVESARKLTVQSRLAEAETLCAGAREIFERAGDTVDSASTQYRIAQLQLRQANVRTGLSLFSQLSETCRERGYRTLLGSVLRSMADASDSLNQHSNALAYSREGLDLAREAGDVDGQISSLVQIALWYRSVAASRQALDSLKSALTLVAPDASADGVGANQLRLIYGVGAHCFACAGLYDAALDYQREALRLAIEADNPLLKSRAYVTMAAFYGKVKNYSLAIDNAKLAIEAAEPRANEPAGREMIAFASLKMGDLYRESGNNNEAIAAYDRNIDFYDARNFPLYSFSAHKGKLLCDIDRNDDAAAQRELESALTVLEESRARIAEESNRNTFFDSEEDIYDLAAGFEFVRHGNRVKAFDYSEASRARSLLDLLDAGTRVVKDNPRADLRLSTPASPMTAADIQARLPRRAQVLQYAVLVDRLLIFVVSGSEINAQSQVISLDELNARVKAYSEAVSRPSADHEAITRSSRELYELLIKPVKPFLDVHKYVCIVPDKILNYLPFAALISPESGHYLISDYEIGTAPSSSVFIRCCEAAALRGEKKNERLLCVGNPSVDRSVYPKLRELPSADVETAAVAGYYPAHRLLSGSAAREKPVATEMERSDVIHFATHYIPDERDPVHSRLLLAKSADTGTGAADSDGSLEAWEIYGRNLTRPRLVVLAACQTGIERFYRGEGAIGISRPFIAAGVPVVVTSLWAVDSEATAALMISFHAGRKVKARTTADALRQAQLEMINGTDSRFKRPYYWASFAATGGLTSF